MTPVNKWITSWNNSIEKWKIVPLDKKKYYLCGRQKIRGSV
jgi:hypothetical protein